MYIVLIVVIVVLAVDVVVSVDDVGVVDAVAAGDVVVAVAAGDVFADDFGVSVWEAVLELLYLLVTVIRFHLDWLEMML